MGMMTVYDLFAGIGGWDVAARRLGLDPIGVEVWTPAIATRLAAGLQTLNKSVAAPSLHILAGGGYEGLIASPPCQTFSAAGNGEGRKALDLVLGGVDELAADPWCDPFEWVDVTDDRTRLVLEPLRWALIGDPDWIAWEQVPTVLPVWEACAEVLRTIGYSVWTGLLHSEQYGVPQTRKRAFLLASRTQHVSAPTPTHSKYYPRDKSRLDEGVLPWVSMAEALGWERDVEVESNYGTGGDPRNRGTRSGDEPFGTVTSKVDRYKVHMGDVVRKNGTVRREDEPAPTITGSADNGNFRWVHERPSPTIVGSFRPDVVAAPGWRKPGDGPRQNTPGSVRVTVEEALVLQGFPPDYPLQGSKTSKYLQVGNAVPPPMAEAALRAVGATSHNTEESAA